MHCCKLWSHELPWTPVKLPPPYPRHDSVPPLHCGPFHASRTSHFTLPVVNGMHPPECMQCIPGSIEIHHYCGPSPGRLGIRMHTCAHISNVHRQLIKRKTLTIEQDWAYPGSPKVNEGRRACITCRTCQAKALYVGEGSMVLWRPIQYVPALMWNLNKNLNQTGRADDI